MARQKVISNKTTQKENPDLQKDLSQMSEWLLHMTVSLYMLLMIVILPFYFTDGYSNIGTDKFALFYKITCVSGIVFFLFLMFYLVEQALICKREGREGRLQWNSRLSVTDWFVLGYGAVVLFSYLLSDYKTGADFGNAFVGINRWYLGLRTQLLLVAVYFAVSRFWKKNKLLPALWIPVTLVVFGLGYLNRFEVRPFEMKNSTVEFISTIGNINWYCGYIVIILFGGVYYFWTMTEKSIWMKIVIGIWMTVGFGTLVTQGSRSGLITLAGIFLVLYLFSMKKEQDLLRFFQCCMCLGLACLVTYFLRSIWPERFNYPDGLGDLLTNSLLALGIPCVAFLLCLLLANLQKKGKFPVKAFVLLGYGGCFLVAFALLVFVVLGVMNTVYPGSLGGLSEIPALTFNLEWGSYRGATWMVGFQCFADQDWIGKLFGVGPDSMALYIQSGQNPKILSIVKECFGNKLLTNGHCEWLTVLVNTGLLGMICYAGLFISAVFRFLKAAKSIPMAGACGLAILAYIINNMFSFQQALSAVTIFMVLGMGEAFIQRNGQIDKS